MIGGFRHKNTKKRGIYNIFVELKAPKVKIDQKEISQVEGYAFSIKADERFRNVNTNWVFWAISDDFGPCAKERITDPSGLIHRNPNIEIFVKTWAQVLDENRARLQFFQEKLEYQADKETSVKFLQNNYDKFLQGVLTEGVDSECVFDEEGTDLEQSE